MDPKFYFCIYFGAAFYLEQGWEDGVGCFAPLCCLAERWGRLAQLGGDGDRREGGGKGWAKGFLFAQEVAQVGIGVWGGAKRAKHL